MKQFLRRISPVRAAKDFAGEWQKPTAHRWPILGVAIAGTFALFMLFIPESQRIEPVSPDVVYVSTWEEDRTQEEIMASNCENQMRRNERADLLARRAEIRRDMYSALGAATGMDVDAIEAEAEAEQTEAEAAQAEAARELRETEEALAQLEFCERNYG